MNHRSPSALAFHMMRLLFGLRDRLRKPTDILRKAGVRSGMTVLDFGCGPGGFTIAAARLVGRGGRVYALDVNPLAIRTVERTAERAGLYNIRTILGSSTVGVLEDSVDLALLYDVLHSLPHPDVVLRDLHRILKRDGLLSVGDHHLPKALVFSTVTSGGLFVLTESDRRRLLFEKARKDKVTT